MGKQYFVKHRENGTYRLRWADSEKMVGNLISDGYEKITRKEAEDLCKKSRSGRPPYMTCTYPEICNDFCNDCARCSDVYIYPAGAIVSCEIIRNCFMMDVPFDGSDVEVPLFRETSYLWSISKKIPR